MKTLRLRKIIKSYYEGKSALENTVAEIQSEMPTKIDLQALLDDVKNHVIDIRTAVDTICDAG